MSPEGVDVALEDVGIVLGHPGDLVTVGSFDADDEDVGLFLLSDGDGGEVLEFFNGAWEGNCAGVEDLEEDFLGLEHLDEGGERIGGTRYGEFTEDVFGAGSASGRGRAFDEDLGGGGVARCAEEDVGGADEEDGEERGPENRSVPAERPEEFPNGDGGTVFWRLPRLKLLFCGRHDVLLSSPDSPRIPGGAFAVNAFSGIVGGFRLFSEACVRARLSSLPASRGMILGRFGGLDRFMGSQELVRW